MNAATVRDWFARCWAALWDGRICNCDPPGTCSFCLEGPDVLVDQSDVRAAMNESIPDAAATERRDIVTGLRVLLDEETKE